jgi:hydroxyacylglutathione hydrolase
MGEIVTIRDEGLGNASYLIDLGDGCGLVLDPSRDPGPYLAAAARRHLRLAWTVETHLHADFISGSHELATMGATVVAPAAAHLEYAHHGLGDGEEVDLGGLSPRTLATPATPPSTWPTCWPTTARWWSCWTPTGPRGGWWAWRCRCW